MQAATDADAQTPMGAKAAELYERFNANGQGGKDFSGIIRMLDAAE
jgi:3-hydroxyisobutyrate dehydrogenase